MPSNRPKLQGYVDSEIHKAFTDWKIEQGFEGDSQALTELLKQFFGFEKPAALGGMSKEDIQELIAEECEIGLREINARVEDHVRTWMEALGEAMGDRISQLEQKLQAVEDKLEVNSGAPSLLQEACQTVNRQYVTAELMALAQEITGLKEEVSKDSQWKIGDRVRVLCKSNYQGREGTIIKFDERLGWHVAVDRWWEAAGLPESSIDERQRKRRIGNIWCDSEEMELLEEITANLPGNLTQTELANRLNCHKSSISYKKESPDFEEWTKERDPDAIAWNYDPKSKRYLSVK